MVTETVGQILKGYDDFLAEFQSLTLQAQEIFTHRNWKGMQELSRNRITLYKRKIFNVTRKVRRELGTHKEDLATWQEIRETFINQTQSRPTAEIAETFFNSICRKIFPQMGADPDIMFVHSPPSLPPHRSVAPIYTHYELAPRPSETLKQLLNSYDWKASFEDLDRDISLVLERIDSDLFADGLGVEDASIEMLHSVFFRNKAAYLVGRIHVGRRTYPFIVPILHTPAGMFVDTLICDADEASVIFSFSRSYFLVEVDVPSEMVRFLQGIMPNKRMGDLYNAIGFNKHGKTEFYRDLLDHLADSEDEFVVAPGIRGLVMAVFTLPSFPVVFKLIKDKIDPPKKTNRGIVKSKYRLVKTHDRVGRMADTHEFEYFEFPRDRFSEELLEELLDVAPSIVHVEGDTVRIDHLYTERRMVPLNLYLESANPSELAEVVDEYGNTIKQLAAVNIFPGDMLLKNFGVTRQRRVVFYDYDEIGFLTEYTFRAMPKAQDPTEIYASSPWYAIGERDVFPEEFRYFMMGHAAMIEIFEELHSELFTPEFWNRMKTLQEKGSIIHAFPYRRYRRFRQLAID